MIAIMQPTFLPWVGYFAMIDRVSQFVFLDSVQFNKRSWQQRNKIKTPTGEMWLTVPVESKGKRDQLIKDTLIQSGPDVIDKMIYAITLNYSRTPYYAEYSSAIFELFRKDKNNLCELNINLIVGICKLLGLQHDKFMRSSELITDGAKADLLVSICQTLNAREYLSAPGSREYIEASGSFQSAGIKVVYHDYQHPKYSQIFGDFIPYLSVLDLLFNEGPKSLEILRQG